MSRYAIICGDFYASNKHSMACVKWDKGSWRKIEAAIRRLMRDRYHTPFIRRKEQTFFVSHDCGKVWDRGNYDRFTFDSEEFVLDAYGKLKPKKKPTAYFVPKDTAIVYWGGGSILENNTVKEKTEYDYYGYITDKRENGIVSLCVTGMVADGKQLCMSGNWSVNVARKAIKRTKLVADYDYDFGVYFLTDKKAILTAA